MSEYPWTPWYTSDYLSATRTLEPLTRAWWSDTLFTMYEFGLDGEVSGTLEQLARLCPGLTVEQMQNVLKDLQHWNTAIVTRNGSVTPEVWTVVSSKAKSLSAERKGNATRQQRWRDRQKEEAKRHRNANVTGQNQNHNQNQNKKGNLSSPRERGADKGLREFFPEFQAAWNQMASSKNVTCSKCMKISDRWKKKLKSRLADSFWREHWREALAKIPESDFLSGRRTDWKATVEFFMRPDSVLKIMQGDYDNSERGGNGEANLPRHDPDPDW